MRLSSVSIVLCASMSLAAPAHADAGVRPVWTDFQPAVATQYRPPDGGRSYPKPDTRTLIRPEDRRETERAEAELNRKAGAPLPDRSGDRLPRPSRRGGSPAAIPPASSTPDLPSSDPAPSVSPIR